MRHHRAAQPLALATHVKRRHDVADKVTHTQTEPRVSVDSPVIDLELVRGRAEQHAAATGTGRKREWRLGTGPFEQVDQIELELE